MRYERVTVDFSSPNITRAPNLLKAAVFLLLEQRYAPTLSAFKKQINSLAVIQVLYILYHSILNVE